MLLYEVFTATDELQIGEMRPFLDALLDLPVTHWLPEDAPEHGALAEIKADLRLLRSNVETMCRLKPNASAAYRLGQKGAEAELEQCVLKLGIASVKFKDMEAAA